MEGSNPGFHNYSWRFTPREKWLHKARLSLDTLYCNMNDLALTEKIDELKL